MNAGNADTCGSVRTEIYVPRGPRTEQRLRKSNPPQEGGLAETSRLAPGVSTSYRTYPFLSERYKFGSHSAGESVARDVVRRRWTRTTHDMDDLRGQDRDESASRAAARRHGGGQCYGCYSKTPAVSHPKPQDGSDHVTDVTDVTANEEGVYVAGVRRRALAGRSPLPFSCCNIRNIRNTRRAFRRFFVSHPGVTPGGWCNIDPGSGVSA
jgi:hypothetical protein